MCYMHELPNHPYIIDSDQLQHRFHDQFKVSHRLELSFIENVAVFNQSNLDTTTSTAGQFFELKYTL